jgi:hypothetical protein
VIPVDEIVAIAKEYLEHDEEVKELVSYLQSDKWNEEIGEIIQSEELNAVSIIVCVFHRPYSDT